MERTKGKWQIELDSGEFCITVNGKDIAQAFTRHSANPKRRIPYEEGKANARLIAAAPKLLDLAELVSQGEHQSACRYHKNPSKCNCPVQDAKDALAAAGGE